MANQYLIVTEDRTVGAWVFIGIINGLEEMFRIRIPVLDVFGGKDWEIARLGADERRRQIMKVKDSEQVMVPDAEHFFEGKEDQLAGIVVKFLDRVFHQGNPASAGR
jgi:alpha/beta superfamily hydrolase